jgi:hypothetical protein
MKRYALLASVALAGLSFASIASAGIVVTGGNFGLLTEARIDMPLDPTNVAIPGMAVFNSFSEMLWATVTGAPVGTQGALYFDSYGAQSCAQRFCQLVALAGLSFASIASAGIVVTGGNFGSLHRSLRRRSYKAAGTREAELN